MFMNRQEQWSETCKNEKWKWVLYTNLMWEGEVLVVVVVLVEKEKEEEVVIHIQLTRLILCSAYWSFCVLIHYGQHHLVVEIIIIIHPWITSSATLNTQTCYNYAVISNVCNLDNITLTKSSSNMKWGLSLSSCTCWGNISEADQPSVWKTKDGDNLRIACEDKLVN